MLKITQNFWRHRSICSHENRRIWWFFFYNNGVAVMKLLFEWLIVFFVGFLSDQTGLHLESTEDQSCPILSPTPGTSSKATTVRTPATPRKVMLKKTISILRTRIWRNKNVQSKRRFSMSRNSNVLSDLIDSALPKQTAAFVKSQIKIHAKKSPKGYRWSMEDKLFAMSVFYHSRKVYQHSTFFHDECSTSCTSIESCCCSWYLYPFDIREITQRSWVKGGIHWSNGQVIQCIE